MAHLPLLHQPWHLPRGDIPPDPRGAAPRGVPPSAKRSPMHRRQASAPCPPPLPCLWLPLHWFSPHGAAIVYQSLGDTGGQDRLSPCPRGAYGLECHCLVVFSDDGVSHLVLGSAGKKREMQVSGNRRLWVHTGLGVEPWWPEKAACVNQT